MIEYEENAEFKAAVEDMLAEKPLVEFNAIREHEIVVFSLLCVRTDANEEHVQCKGDPIVCKKIPPPLQLLTGGHYLIIGDYYFWTHANKEQQRANLYHALMHIEVEESDKGGVKIGTRKPEVRVFRSEVTRFGAHNELLLDFREAFKQSAKQFTETHKTKN